MRTLTDSILLDIVAKFVKMDSGTENYTVGGDALMNGGIRLEQALGSTGYNGEVRYFQDFGPRIYLWRNVELMKSKTILTTLLVLFIIMALGFGGLFVYSKFIKKDTGYVGTWEREVNITDYVTDVMDVWMDRALVGAVADYGDEQVIVKVVLTLTDSGTWVESVDESYYNNVTKNQAVSLASEGLRDFLEKRIQSTGISTAEVGKTIDELVDEALGMTVEQYIEQYGPRILPDLNELKAMYNCDGSYNVKKDVLARSKSKGETIYESFVQKDDFLIITGTAESTGEVENKKGSSIAISINDEDDKTPDNIDGITVVYPLVYSKQ